MMDLKKLHERIDSIVGEVRAEDRLSERGKELLRELRSDVDSAVIHEAAKVGLAVGKKKPSECGHSSFSAAVDVNRLEDSGKFIADVRVKCDECDEPFRFLGVDAGISFSRPACSIDGLELHAPIEPELEARLLGRASFEVPTLPRKH